MCRIKMKKIIVSILVIAFAVSLAACSLPGMKDSDPADNYKSIIDPDDIESVKALNHKVFEANTPESILSNHESYSLKWSTPDGDAPDEYHYMTKEIKYNEWSNGYKEYVKGRVSYISNYEEDPEKCYAQYELNINDELPGCSMIFSETEAEAFNYETDVFDKAYIKDGILHILTHYNKKGVDKYIKEYYDRESDGEQIFTELTTDAATYEAVNLTIIMEKDGAKQISFIADAEYDTALPEAAKAIVSFFERPSENMMNFKVVADKGTDRELIFDVNIQKNVECSILYEGESVMFDDPDYSTLSHWDRMSDKVAYIVRDPDEKIKEKYKEAYDEYLKKKSEE